MSQQIDLVETLQDCLYQLDGVGGIESELIFPSPDNHKNYLLAKRNPYFAVLNLDNEEVNYPQFLAALEHVQLINNRVNDLLQEPNYKPRLIRNGETLLLTVKFYQPVAEAVIAVRICINEQLILIAQDSSVSCINELKQTLIEQVGISGSSEALIVLLEEMSQLFSEYIEDLHDDILNIEEKLLEDKLSDRSELISTRKSLTLLRRNLAPIKDLVARLAIEKLRWLDPEHHQQLHEITEHLRREIEEVNACIARTAIVSEELNTLITDNINKRLYIMSIVTVIFMPVTFITGLFGVNLGGIPGNESVTAFAGFTGMILVVLLIIILILKVKKWF